MNTDCAFYIGSTHEVCQDYCLANKNSMVVSDGCSSSVKSDIGSRILGITGLNMTQEQQSLISFNEKECILRSRPPIQMLNIPNECLDATLLAAKKRRSSLEAICCGDGVIAIKTKAGDTIIINCSYSDSYPFYINYLCEYTGRYDNWAKSHNKIEVTMDFTSSKGEVNNYIVGSASGAIKRIPKDIGIVKVLEYKTFVEITDINLIEYVAIMSDGIHSFYETITTETSKFNKSVPFLEVLKDLLTFKNINQKFVQRRINKFRKNCEQKRWSNADDFSIAVMHME